MLLPLVPKPLALEDCSTNLCSSEERLVISELMSEPLLEDFLPLPSVIAIYAEIEQTHT